LLSSTIGPIQASNSRKVRKKQSAKGGLRTLSGEDFLLPTELQWSSFRHFVSARLIGRGIGSAVRGLNQAVSQKKSFDFFTADVWQHAAIDLDAWAKHLAAFLNHFLALHRVINDIAVLEGKLIFTQDGAHTLAPATARFQIGNNLWFIHS